MHTARYVYLSYLNGKKHKRTDKTTYYQDKVNYYHGTTSLTKVDDRYCTYQYLDGKKEVIITTYDDKDNISMTRHITEKYSHPTEIEKIAIKHDITPIEYNDRFEWLCRANSGVYTFIQYKTGIGKYIYYTKRNNEVLMIEYRGNKLFINSKNKTIATIIDMLNEDYQIA